uniref:Uncharacterized protein n=1 Tax=Tanacetum cinerariifolium TaxID=118510 RepID=A0A699K8K7_TANCI|nr:hypothetical protein [Tanacetum cinerariifolium]
MDTIKITATKVEITERNKADLPRYKNDHKHYNKSDGGFNQKIDQEDLKTYTASFVIRGENIGSNPSFSCGRTSYSGYPDRPSLLPHQNLPPSGTSSGPGYVNQVPPSYSSSGYPASTGYNSGGYASAVAAAAQEYPGQNSYRPLMNRLLPIRGDMLTVDTMVYLQATQDNLTCPRLVKRSSWCDVPGHLYY